MKKGIKIATAGIAVLLVLMFLLPFAFQGKITELVKQEGNKMLQAQFDFKKLSISLFRNFPKASLTLEDFWLKGVGEFENDTLVQAAEVTAAVNLFSLFGSQGYDISRIAIKDTRLHAIVLPDGRANWDVTKPDSTADTPDTEEATAFRIQLKELTLKNIELIYDDRQGNMYAQVRNLSASCSGDLGSNRTLLKLDAETPALTYKMNGIPFLKEVQLAAKMDIDADLENHRFTLKENSFRLNAIRTGIDGWVALQDPAIEMDLRLNTEDTGFKEILSLVPAIYATQFADLQTDGTASLAATAKGTLLGDTVPAFDVALQVKDAMFRYPTLPAGVDRINVSAAIHNPGGSADLTTITIQPFDFRMAGTPFSLTAHIKTPVSDPDFQATAKGILNLGMVKQVYPLTDMELNGTVNADMQVAGRLSAIEKEQYDRILASGTVALTDMKLQMKDMPEVDIKKSLLTFTPRYLQLSETAVNIGQNDITADSRLENYIGYALKGTTLKGNLNIRSNRLNLNDFMTDTAEAAATDSTAATTTMSIIEVPRNVDFQMNANLKQVLFDQMTFGNMNGALAVKDAKVEMKNLSMNTMGGTAVMNGYYATTDPQKPQLKAAFALKNIGFAQAYKELDMLKTLAPIFENLQGNFSGNLNILTTLDGEMSPVFESLQGSGSLSSKDLSLSGVKAIDLIADAVKQENLKNMRVKDLTLDFTIKDGRVETKPFDLRMGDYSLNLSGTTGLDQTIAYSGRVKLPASAGTLSQLTTLDLKIGGSFTSPKVSVDTKSMATQVVQNVAAEAVGKLGQKLGLDSATVANTDSLKQKVTEKVKEKATQKALDFLKKLK